MEKTTCPVCGQSFDDDVDVCPACGFKMKGSTQRFAPYQVDDAAVPATAGPKKATLKIVRGPQIETMFTLADAPMKVGRSPQCDIFLNDMTVSREHAQIVPDAEGYAVVDTGSYNGVWVNNESVTTHRLADGDIVQVGAFCLLYQE